MHDEECAIGLWVRNGNKKRWRCYGDTRLNAKVNFENRTLCLDALQRVGS